jgi:hypothetical protein
MYYPQSQIKTNLYTNGGEFIVATTGTLYQGYYYTVSNGKIFTEKSPTPNSKELIPISNSQPPQSPQSINKVPSSVALTYDSLINSPLNARYLPLSISPSPTQEDYNVGEFQRYFAKKINEVIYIETDKDTYTKLVNKNPELYYEQYVAFDLPWDISGEKQQVYNTNKSIVERMMVKNKLPKFGDYLKFDYLKYYK